MTGPTLPRSITNTVVHGEARGRLLGFPTANLRFPDGEETPEHGIYAGRALGHAAAVSIGVRPTYGEGLEPLIEAHLLDFDGDLYDRELTVELLEYLRPELRFDSEQALRDQIAADIDAVRAKVAL